MMPLPLQRAPRGRRIRRGAAATAVLLLAGCGEGRMPPGPPMDAGPVKGYTVSGRAAVLPLASAPRMLDACGREVPGGIEGFWTPGEALVRRVERDLPRVLDRVLARVARANDFPRRDRTDDYLRQYIGIRRNGRALVYINGVHRMMADDLNRSFDGTGLVPAPLRWMREPLDACDGGAAFFGVEYDPATGEFGRVEFNQSFDGLVRY